MTSTSGGTSRSDVARCWAGFASLGAGLVHFGVVREHLDYWTPAGVFFVVVGVAQVLWALAALARERIPAPRLAVGATLGLLALWALTRTAGLPFGPDAWTAEPVGRADSLCMVLQLIMVGSAVAAVRLARPAYARRSPTRHAAARALTGLAAGALVTSALTTPALAATEAGERARPHFHHSGGHGH